jgi:hypothetical protein
MSEKPKRGRKADPESKRSRKVDRHAGIRVVVYLTDSQVAEMDRHLGGLIPPGTRAGFVRMAVDRLLADVRRPKR